MLLLLFKQTYESVVVEEERRPRDGRITDIRFYYFHFCNNIARQNKYNIRF